MKITKQRLGEIIQEELDALALEGRAGDFMRRIFDPRSDLENIIDEPIGPGAAVGGASEPEAFPELPDVQAAAKKEHDRAAAAQRRELIARSRESGTETKILPRRRLK